MVGHQKLGLVKQGQLLFGVISLDDDGYLVGMLLLDKIDIGNPLI